MNEITIGNANSLTLHVRPSLFAQKFLRIFFDLLLIYAPIILWSCSKKSLFAASVRHSLSSLFRIRYPFCVFFALDVVINQSFVEYVHQCQFQLNKFIFLWHDSTSLKCHTKNIAQSNENNQFDC